MLSTQFSPCCEALYRVSFKYLDNVRSTMDYVKIRKKLRYPFHSTMFYQAAVREREKNEAFRRSNFHHSSMHYEKIERTRCKRFTRRTKEHSTLVDLSDHAKAQCTRSMAETRGKRRKKRAEREKKKKKREKGHPFENGSQNGIVTHGMPRLAIETGAWEHDRPIHGSHAIHSATVRPISGDPTRATEHTVQHSNPSSRPTLRKEACVVLPFPHKTLSNTRVHIYLNTHAVVCARAYITATTTLCNTRHTRVHTRGLRLRKRAKE